MDWYFFFYSVYLRSLYPFNMWMDPVDTMVVAISWSKFYDVPFSTHLRDLRVKVMDLF